MAFVSDQSHDSLLRARNTVFAFDPRSVGMMPTERFPWVWAVVMDVAEEGGTSTLIVMADGTANLVSTSEGDVVGRGADPEVANSAAALFDEVHKYLGTFPALVDTALPAPGAAKLTVLGWHDHRGAVAEHRQIATSQHPLSAVFLAADAVVVNLRSLPS